jgi:hypothetical protein
MEFTGIIPSVAAFQKLRLILSTYQDGSGQQHISDKITLPGWRDFERAVAITFQGKAQENKSVFDVLVRDTEKPELYYGISCKMRNTLKETSKKGFVSLELSNSSGQFWSAIKQTGLNEQTYREYPDTVGKALLDRVQSWHKAVSTEANGKVLLAKSFFLTLAWDSQTELYQLHQFHHLLPDPVDLTWTFPSTKRLLGNKNGHKLIEWYGESGDQLKYYPLIQDAIWQSEVFKLEPLPTHSDLQAVIMAKIHSYFPQLWSQIQEAN